MAFGPYDMQAAHSQHFYLIGITRSLDRFEGFGLLVFAQLFASIDHLLLKECFGIAT